MAKMTMRRKEVTETHGSLRRRYYRDSSLVMSEVGVITKRHHLTAYFRIKIGYIEIG